MANNPKGMKEFVRKRIVALKRRPQTIAMLVLAIAFVYYSFNLTHVSDTTAKIQGPGMGLCGFTTMLFSVLAMVCHMNAYPRRKKTNIPMLVIMFLMIGTVIFCDVHYMGLIEAAITRENNPIDLIANPYIATVQNVLSVHVVILIIAVLLVALMPLYAKLLRRINTSVEVEANEEMGAIDISGED